MPKVVNKKILIVTPHLSAKGGISIYYNSLLPYFNAKEEIEVTLVQTGTYHLPLNTGSIKKALYLFKDWYIFIKIIASKKFV